MGSYMRTGVTIDCPCGATGVPVGWTKPNEKFGNLDDPADHSYRMSAYKHAEGEPYKRSNQRGDKCLGPRDLFLFMLAEAELMMVADGLRLGKKSERVAGDMAVPLDLGLMND